MIDTLHLTLMDLLDIGLVALVVYYVLRLIRGTHAEQMLIGVVVMVVLYEVARQFGLPTVEWIFNQVFAVFIVILVVLFQAEIRKGLMRVAVNPLAGQMLPQDALVDAVVRAADMLVERKWGALIVFERETGLKHLDESGVLLHAKVQAELLVTLFSPDTPMHDGAVILGLNDDSNVEIRSARVLLPLAKSKDVDGGYGTRHRAAIGLTEQNDALVVVVSEEREDVHIVENGEMSIALQGEDLARELALRLQGMPSTRGAR